MALFVTPRERRLWGWSLGLLLLIYSTLSVVRPLTELLRDLRLLIPGLVLVFGLCVGFALRELRRNWPGPWETATLVAIATAYGILLLFLHTPEEAMHFVQYGLAAILFHAALSERRRGREAQWSSGSFQGSESSDTSLSAPLRHPALGAFVLTVTAGWLDEGIQYLLPSRYYDLRDVAFNAAAGALALISVLGRERARRRDMGREVERDMARDA